MRATLWRIGTIAAASVALGACAGGFARLDCGVRPDGAVHDCRVLEESPPGSGFGQAAVDASTGARLSEATMRNPSATGRVEFTVRFRKAVGAELAAPDRP